MAYVAVGVTGGIGAYKAVELVRGLQRHGHEVVAVMTRAARRFVGPVTFEAITRRRVVTDQFAPGVNADIEHIAIASEIDLLVVAPATANIIGKFAAGIADDFLSSLYLATRAPVLMAPAMNTHMLEHDAVRRNLATLEARGVRFVAPGEGFLACGWIGKGRLAEPDEVVVEAERILRPATRLSGRRVLVTAGPTYEDLDAVRYLGNRSSGRMGLALAAEAARRGARVVLVTGPTRLDPPAGVTVVRIRSAAQMHAAVFAEAPSADVILMAAAVADYTPADAPAGEKISKGPAAVAVDLVRTRDILAELGQWRGDATRPVLVGFAAESRDLVARGRQKLAAKRVDLVVANDISRTDRGFEADTNAVTIIAPEGEQVVGLQSKAGIASTILDRVTALLERPAGVTTGNREPGTRSWEPGTG